MNKNFLKIVASVVTVSSLVYAQSEIRVSIPAYGESTKPGFQKIVADFEKENPGIKVNLEVGSWSSWQQKLQTDFFSGGNADLIYSTRGWVPTYVGGNKLEALDSYLTKEDLGQFPNSLIEAAKVNGKLYALPSVTSARNLYVNTDLIKKAGAKIPKTWDELRETAKLVSQKTDASGFGIQGKEVEMEKYFYYALWNFGGSVLDKTVGGTKSALDSDAALKAAKFYNDLIKNGYSQKNVASYNREDLQELFKQGKLAMMITHGVLAEQIQSEGHDVNFVQTDVPGLMENKKGTTLGVIDAVHLSENSKAKKDAVKFLMHTFKPKYQADWIAKANLLPVTTAAGNEKEFDKKHLQAMIAAVPNAKFAFIHKKSTKVIDILKNELQAMYSGKKTPEEALNAAHKKINRAARR
ncbi:MAG: sugar ABC transporter substrate-binding protein [Arcobacter sp.]|nr:sugar ABC transporter substrate-binding protein [Arcobacter sp.]